jgi:hypothetical protein
VAQTVAQWPNDDNTRALPLLDQVRRSLSALRNELLAAAECGDALATMTEAVLRATGQEPHPTTNTA